MGQNILQELAIIQNIEVKTREPLQKIKNNKKNQLKIKIGNSAMKEIIKMKEPNLNQLNGAIYATAKVVTEECTKKEEKR